MDKNEKVIKDAVVNAILSNEKLDKRAREIYDNSKVMNYIKAQADFFEQNNWTLIEIAEVGRAFINFATASLAANGAEKSINEIVNNLALDLFKSKINEVVDSEKQ
ncbi:hypothetical protein [Atopobium fossor]|uniref:hypothetical protein n=1 Tax=Atopobium fossor TaxID=39487 RepID=UPI00040FA760|nr:hypothetical protein [Atopobium fossor]